MKRCRVHLHWALPDSQEPLGSKLHPKEGVLVQVCKDCGFVKEIRPWQEDPKDAWYRPIQRTNYGDYIPRINYS